MAGLLGIDFRNLLGLHHVSRHAQSFVVPARHSGFSSLFLNELLRSNSLLSTLSLTLGFNELVVCSLQKCV